MMDMIYKKKMTYFEHGGDEDWKEILARSYPREAPKVEPPIYNKEQVHNSCFKYVIYATGNLLQVYENNYDVFEEADATATRIAQDEYRCFTNLVRDLIEGYTADVDKARVIFRQPK